MKRILALVQVVLLVGLSSCGEDFLTKEPPAVAAGSALQNPTGVEGLLTGTYSMMRGDSIFGAAMITDWVYGSGASDEAYKGSEAVDQNNFNDIERYGATSANAYLAERWRECYNIVARANQALIFLKTTLDAGVDLGNAKGSYSTTADRKRATEIEAELKFLRAWAHFQAQKVFKNIPYIKTSDEMDGKLDIEIPNPGPVWDDIEAELQFAIDNLPNRFNGEPGRADKFAAMAVKAHVHMYQNELTTAAPILQEIIDKGVDPAGDPLKLVTNYYDNYDESTENNSESIFEYQATTAAGGHTSLRLTGAVFPQAGGPSVGGWGFYQPSQVLVEAFQVRDDGLPYLEIGDRPVFKNDMGVDASTEFIPSTQLIDPRLDWTVTRRGVDVNGWGIATTSLVRDPANGGPYMTKKFLHEEKNRANQNGSGFNNERNFRMYRLGHILLWRAECHVEAGELDKARDLVNQIRSRAKGSKVVMGVCSVYTFDAATVADELTDWTRPAGNYKVEPYPAGHAAFASQAEARKAVRLELQLEFATEGHRFFDLRRWGEGTATPDYDLTVLSEFIRRDVAFRGFMSGATYNPSEDRYWPIPQAQLDLQRGVLTAY